MCTIYCTLDPLTTLHIYRTAMYESIISHNTAPRLLVVSKSMRWHRPAHHEMAASLSCTQHLVRADFLRGFCDFFGGVNRTIQKPYLLCSTRKHMHQILSWYYKVLEKQHIFKDWGFLRKIQKMHLSPKTGWIEQLIARKCFPRAFQWIVMSVGFDNLKYFGQFLCPALGDRSHYQPLTL
jgi:hypothetical protein